MKLLDTFQKRKVALPLIIFLAVSIMAAGTYAWISLVQRITNEFKYEPYDIRLIKLDSVTRERLAGAEFDLYTESGAFVGNYITDINGEIVISNSLEEGKSYYFRETEPPAGYRALTTDIPFIADGKDIEVENTALSMLSISKRISDKDIDGKDYIPTTEELEFQFKFSVIIGDKTDPNYDLNAEYDYVIKNEIGDVKDSGKIKSEDIIYLRHGETAIIQGASRGTYYNVTENDVCEVDLDPDIADDGFNCDNPDYPHSKTIGTAYGWASFGSNTNGYLKETGSTAKFKNIKINSEVTISSLVVIDRIVDEKLDGNELDYMRREAYWHQIDHAQGFDVRVVIGDDELQSYYYEVVYIDETQRDEINNNAHEHVSDYYNINDPHFYWHQTVRYASGYAAQLKLNTLSPSLASIRSNDQYKPPIHKPSEYERWKRRDGRYHESTLKVSRGNVIEVTLHHQAAVIIYGIPTFTKYTAEQVERWNNGYLLHSDYNAQGLILPDLNRILDPNYDEQASFPDNVLLSAGLDSYDSEAPALWHTRADIFNYYPHDKEIMLEKVWEDDNNYNGRRPVSIDVKVTGKASGNTVYERNVKLSHSNNWKETLAVPEYDVDMTTKIAYSVSEQQVNGYKPPQIDVTQSGFKITNTYDPELASIIVKKIVNGSGADKNKQFTFTVDIGGTKNTFTLKDGEQRAFTGVPVGTPYTVTEDSKSAQGYVISSVNSTGTILSGGVTAIFTNTKKTSSEKEDDTGELIVRKHVEGEGADSNREFRFTVIIGGEKQVIYLRGGESETFDDIPVGTHYSVVEDRYTGYTTSSNGATGTIKSSGNAAVFTNTHDGKKATGSLTVIKTVRGDGADRSKRFDFTATIGRYTYHLSLKDGESYMFTDIPVGTAYSVSEASYTSQGYTTNADGTSGTIVSNGNTAAFVNTKGETTGGNGELIVTKTISGQFVDTTKKFRFVAKIGAVEHEFFLKHGERRVFADIPSGTAYTVTEDDYSSQDYITTSTGAAGTMTDAGATAAFVNEYTGESWPKPDADAVQISGKKSWNHGTNTNLPQRITVFVMDGDKIVTRKTVTAQDNWSYAYNLPRYADDGREIVYSVNEDAVKNYEKAVKGYDLENTYSPAGNPGTGDRKVLWIWFIIILVGSIGLRAVVFYRKKRREPR